MKFPVERYQQALKLRPGSADHVATAGKVLLGKRQPVHSLGCSGRGKSGLLRKLLKMGLVDALGSLQHLMLCDCSFEQQSCTISARRCSPSSTG